MAAELLSGTSGWEPSFASSSTGSLAPALTQSTIQSAFPTLPESEGLPPLAWPIDRATPAWRVKAPGFNPGSISRQKNWGGPLEASVCLQRKQPACSQVATFLVAPRDVTTGVAAAGSTQCPPQRGMTPPHPTSVQPSPGTAASRSGQQSDFCCSPRGGQRLPREGS